VSQEVTDATSNPSGIWAAILEFQSDPPVLKKTKAGHQSKYADMVQINEVVLPRLNKLGITYTALPTMTEDEKFRLRYELRHVPSGETIVGFYPLKMSENPQHMGSATSYARRYALLAVLDIAAEDEDDDGHAASGRATAQRAAPAGRQAPTTPAKRTAQRAAAPPPPLPSDGPQPYTPGQRAKLMALLGQLGVEDRTERLDIFSRIVGRELASANELLRDEAGTLIDRLEAATKEDNPMLALAEATGSTDG
jgi:hypothetical protein